MNMTVKLLDRPDEATWLTQRREYITATDIARLANGGPAQWAVVKAEKQGTAPNFTGNRYTEWGKERERFIVANLEFLYGVQPNEQLAVLDGTQWAGTPDAIGDGLLGEVKTTVRDWEVNPKALPQNYQDQMLWCQHIFDVDRTAFGWEVNENFTPGPQRHLLYPRDDERISYLVETAEQFLNYLENDKSVGEWEDVTAQASVIKRRLDAAQAEWDALMDTIRERAGDSDVAVKNAFGSISLAYPKATTRFDVTAFRAAHEALYNQFLTATPPAKRTLRVTPRMEN